MKLLYKYILFILSILFIYSCSTEDVTVGLATELGAFNVPAKQLSSVPFELTPPTSSRAGSFSYQSSNPEVAVINGSTLTIVGVGTTTITATQSDYQKYAEVSTTANFTVTEFEPATLGAFNVPSKFIGDTPFLLTEPTSNSTGAFTYTSSNPSVATISGSTVTILAVGTTTITATQAKKSPYDVANVSATLEVTIPPANITADNFLGIDGSNLTANGWIAHSSIVTNPIKNTSPGLTFPKYFGSDIGNAASVTSIGQDVSLKFTTVTSGTVYASFLIKATPSTLLNEYFFAFGNNDTADTSYRGKLSINQDTTDPTKFRFGFAANLTIKTTLPVYNYGETYLVIIKYNIIPAGTLNASGNTFGRDETSLYVFNASSSYKTEPSTPTIGIEDTSSADILPGRVVIRQDNTISPNVIIDGLRIDTNWNITN
jgi:hypothetical protein